MSSYLSLNSRAAWASATTVIACFILGIMTSPPLFLMTGISLFIASAGLCVGAEIARLRPIVVIVGMVGLACFCAGVFAAGVVGTLISIAFVGGILEVIVAKNPLARALSEVGEKPASQAAKERARFGLILFAVFSLGIAAIAFVVSHVGRDGQWILPMAIGTFPGFLALLAAIFVSRDGAAGPKEFRASDA